MVELIGLKGLQGLDDLLVETKSEKLPAKETIFNLSIDVLQSGKYQPRSHIDDAALHELASSIRSQGIILPLVVRSLAVNQYEIIAGERRWRAAKIAGLKHVPVVIRDVPDETALAFALIENIQREALNPIEEALAFARLKNDFLMTHDEIAERVGRSRSAVTNLMRLLGLHDEVKALVRVRIIEMGHARALLGLNEHDQKAFAEKIVEKKLSVRDTERMVKKNKRSNINQSVDHGNLDDRISAWERLFYELFSLPVQIQPSKVGGYKIIIQSHSADDIERILKTING